MSARLSPGRSITAAEAADRLGISLRTLDRWQASGKLVPLVNLGGRGGRKYDDQHVERVRRGLPAT